MKNNEIFKIIRDYYDINLEDLTAGLHFSKNKVVDLVSGRRIFSPEDALRVTQFFKLPVNSFAELYNAFLMNVNPEHPTLNLIYIRHKTIQAFKRDMFSRI